MLSTSKIEEVSQNSFVAFKLAERQIDRQTDRWTTTTATALHYHYKYKNKYTTLQYTNYTTLHSLHYTAPNTLHYAN